MVDTNFDNFFDMTVVGDTSGSLWSIDMLNPGTLSGGLVTNWFGGLTFQQFKGSALSNRSPFFAMAAARVFDDSKGGVRVYLGGGDRDQIKIRDTDAIDGGTCQLDNLRGCIRNNCTVDVLQNKYAIGAAAPAAQALVGEWKYVAGGTALATNTFSLTNSTTAGSCTDPALVDIRYQVSCNGTVMVDPSDGGTPLLNELGCDFDGGNDGGEECYDVRGMPEGAGVAFTSPAISNSRFYSVKVFDPPTYLNRPRMISSSAQSTYNLHTLTDTDLTDVSGDAGMPGSAAGWFLKHANDANEKTASAALLLGGCVAWNTELPSVMNNTPGADGGQVCSTGGSIPPDTAFLYQANDDTGVVQCGLPGSSTQAATSRYVARLVTVTPQQPTPVVSLNASTGQAAYSGVSLEPGGKIPLQILVGAAAVQGDVSWMDVPRNLHACRHPADGGVPNCTN
jgi:type IV pilus assembly protein PilY1